jgi:hypothetical protein
MRIADEPVNTDTDRALLLIVEGDLREAGLLEPGTDHGRQVRRASVPCPYDGRTRLAQGGKVAHGVRHVLVGDVPEDAADKKDVSRYSAVVAADHPCVVTDHFDIVRSGQRGRRSGRLHVALVALDQSGPDVSVPRVFCEHRDHVATFTCADADQAQITRRRAVESLSQVASYERQTAR